MSTPTKVSGEYVRSREWHEILRRREAAGLLTPKALAWSLVRWVRDQLLPPEALAQFAFCWIETNPEPEKGLSALQEAAKEEPPSVPAASKGEEARKTLAQIIMRRLDPDLLQSDRVAAVVKRWTKAGLLPPESILISEAVLERLTVGSVLPELAKALANRDCDCCEKLLQKHPYMGRLEAIEERRNEFWASARQTSGDATEDGEEKGVPEGDDRSSLDASIKEAEIDLLEVVEAYNKLLETDNNKLDSFVKSRKESGRLGQSDKLSTEEEVLVLEALILEALTLEEVARGRSVGLAFSGGGIRSASFNLGILQALHRLKLLRQVDFLSTVSGGSYIGAWLDSRKNLSALDNAYKGEDELKNAHKRGDELKNAAKGRKDEAIQRLIQAGYYLRHPLVFANYYVFGLLLTNLLLGIFLLLLCAVVAYLWRLLDQSPICETILVLTGGVLIEAYRPFMVALILFLTWLLAWILTTESMQDYLRRLRKSSPEKITMIGIGVFLLFLAVTLVWPVLEEYHLCLAPDYLLWRLVRPLPLFLAIAWPLAWYLAFPRNSDPRPLLRRLSLWNRLLSRYPRLRWHPDLLLRRLSLWLREYSRSLRRPGQLSERLSLWFLVLFRMLVLLFRGLPRPLQQILWFLLLLLLAWGVLWGFEAFFTPGYAIETFLRLLLIPATAVYIVPGIVLIATTAVYIGLRIWIRSRPVEAIPEAPASVRRAAGPLRVLLLLAGCSLLVGSVVWLATPSINTVPLISTPQQSPGSGTIEQHSSWIYPLLGALLTSLLPFLNPRRLLESGLRPKQFWEPWVFRVASLAAVIGIPLLGIYLFARHNVSGHNTNREPKLLHADLANWAQFWEQVKHESGQGEEPGWTIWSKLHAKIDESRRTAEDILQDPELATIIIEQPVPISPRALRDKEWIKDQLNKIIFDGTSPLNPGGPWNGLIQTWKQRATGAQKGELPANWVQIKPLLDQVEQQSPVTRKDVEVQTKTNKNIKRLVLEAHYGNDVIESRDTVRREKVVGPDEVFRLVWILALLVLAVGVLRIVKLNMTSLHWYYRERLASVYLGSDLGQRGARPGSQQLSKLDTVAQGKPYHLIHATLNVLTIPQLILKAFGWSRDDEAEPGRSQPAIAFGPDGDCPSECQPALELRPADALAEEGCTEDFLFSRHFCGSDHTGYLKTATYETASRLHLGDAVALSGAAVSLTQIDNPLILLLMAVLNFRLGQWLPNPALVASADANHDVSELERPTLRALLSDGFNGRQRGNYFISDGGHHDNLGLESLLDRRCSLILISDATYDPSYEFRDFLRVLRRVRQKHGIELVCIDGEPKRPALPLDRVRPRVWRADATAESKEGAGPARAEKPTKSDRDGRATTQQAAPFNGKNRESWSDSHYFAAKIRYPKEPGRDAATGLLIYLKPSITGDEASDLMGHWAENLAFPHDPTSNQFYDENMVESYRQLGEHIGKQVCNELFVELETKDELNLENMDRNLRRKSSKIASPPASSPMAVPAPAMTISKAPDDRETLLEIWKCSVRATHPDLTEAQIEKLVPQVRDRYLVELELLVLYLVEDGRQKEAIGFLGLSGAKVEGLFLAPKYRGHGCGRMLLDYARQLKGPLTIYGNEQYAEALRFYEACGFRVVGRSELNGQGPPFSLLHLRESTNGQGSAFPLLHLREITDWQSYWEPF